MKELWAPKTFREAPSTGVGTTVRVGPTRSAKITNSEGSRNAAGQSWSVGFALGHISEGEDNSAPFGGANRESCVKNGCVQGKDTAGKPLQRRNYSMKDLGLTAALAVTVLTLKRLIGRTGTPRSPAGS